MTHAEPQWRRWVWSLSGLTLAGLMVWGGLAFHHIPDDAPISRALASAAPIFTAACGAYFLALLTTPSRIDRRRALILLVLVGSAVRVTLLFSDPIDGMDHCRYRWDGAVAAAGANPYRWSPQQLIDGAADDDPKLRDLVRSGQHVIESVNHPQYRTIYPPVAQLLFALGHLITPFGIAGWRLVLAACDAAAVVILIRLLREARLPVAYLAVYLWNPLLAVETYFGSHVDLAAATAVVLALYLASRRRVIGSAAVLALATGIKLWPALLIFVVLATVRREPRRMIAAGVVYLGLVGAMAIPFASAFGDGTSGVEAYAARWYANTGLFVVLRAAGQWLTEALTLDIDGRLVARGMLAALLLAFALWRARGAHCDAVDLCRRASMIVLIMLLLSPTLYPWYYLAVLPLACAAVRPSLLIWTFLLPMSYLTMHGPDRDHATLTTLLIHVPVWLLLVLEWFMGRRSRRSATGIGDA